MCRGSIRSRGLCRLGLPGLRLFFGGTDDLRGATVVWFCGSVDTVSLFVCLFVCLSVCCCFCVGAGEGGMGMAMGMGMGMISWAGWDM